MPSDEVSESLGRFVPTLRDQVLDHAEHPLVQSDSPQLASRSKGGASGSNAFEMFKRQHRLLASRVPDRRVSGHRKLQ